MKTPARVTPRHVLTGRPGIQRVEGHIGRRFTLGGLGAGPADRPNWWPGSHPTNTWPGSRATEVPARCIEAQRAGRNAPCKDRRMSLEATSDLWWKNAVVYCVDTQAYL
ncbi:MAG: hypothetical protein ACT4OQ_07415, partial [Chloroflexota bacterium]